MIIGISGLTSLHAFRWTQATGMVQLNTPGNAISNAVAISLDGGTIVGTMNGNNGLSQAVRWNGGSAILLETLPGTTSSGAAAVSGNGGVIVGSVNYSGGAEAFRWTQAGGMQTVRDWLRAGGVNMANVQLDSALGVDTTGTIISGNGLINGVNQPYLARASGLVGLTDLAGSLAATQSLSLQQESLTSLALNGAHHRTLMDMARPADGSYTGCAWASGDLGGYRSHAGSATVAEAGACRDFAGRSVRAGIGVGHSEARLDQANGGYSRLHGDYLVGEVDWAIARTPLVASALVLTGRWNAGLRRGYSVAATSPSMGSTTIDATTLRARLDWRDAFALGPVRFTPSVAYTRTYSRTAAYQETDGTAPAYFDAQRHAAGESRATLTGAYAFSADTALHGRLEWAHRYDRQTAAVSGSVNALGIVLPFSYAGNPVPRDWARVGLDLDQRIGARGVLTLSGNLASSGADASWSVAASYTHYF